MKRRTKIGIGAAVVIGGLFGIGAAAGSSSSPGKVSAAGTTVTMPTSAPSASASASPSAAGPAVVRRSIRIVFTVRGSAPQGADITYGSDTDNRSPQGGLGFDGSGTTIPWSGSVKYHRSALYYSITAQLQGGGNITCKVRVQVAEWFSDGTHYIRSRTVAQGHASGSYNVCDAQSS